jgi:Neurotransmitter-gated ion-channel ligand binding domain
MKRTITRRVLRGLLYCLLLAFAGMPDCRAAKVPLNTPVVDLHLPPPTNGNAPIEVGVGLYITNFVAIDETRETFEVGGFLTGQWQDPRLALPADQTSTRAGDLDATRTFRLEDLWTPSIEGTNSVNHKTNQYSLEADREGTVTYRERFDAVYSNDYALRKFPFDTQSLHFEFQPFLAHASQIQFAAKALPFTGISPEQHTELAAWRLQTLRYTADKLTGDPFMPASHEAIFELTAVRRSGFYVWKIFLPLIMITLVPTIVFWIDVKEFDWILKIPMTMLLSMVAFQFSVARDLPRIGYITFFDAVFLASFIFCFLGVFEITLVYLLQKYGRRPLAVRLHTAGRWGYPLAYFGVLLILGVTFLA